MRSEIPTIVLLGVPIAAISREQALAEIDALQAADAPAIVAFANAHTLNVVSDDESFRSLIQTVDLLLNDGVGLEIGARLQGERFPDNLNGTDLTPQVLASAARRGSKVFLLGGRPGVAEEAARRLVTEHDGLQIVGTHHGFVEDGTSDDVVALVRSAETDVLLVGMGNPRQERWLAANIEATGARLGIGVGAFIDFSAGTVQRAPDVIRRMRLEWVYRLLLEPRRLVRRYLVGNPLFLARVTKEALVRRAQQRRVARSR